MRERVASSEAVASTKQQGRCIAYIRQLPKQERKRLAQIVKSDWREASISAIRKHLRKLQRKFPRLPNDSDPVRV